jgi:RNA recognition motif-containing protein
MFAYFRQKDTQRVYEEAVEQLQQKFLEPKGRRLVIGNLPHAATQSDLKQFFKDYEFISAVHPNNHDGRSAGHAVVDVLTYAYAKRAVRDLDGGRLGDRRVSVRLAPSSHIQGGSGNAGANIQKIDESMRLKLIAWLRGEGEQNEDLNIRESNASSTKDSAGQPTGDAVEQNRSPHIARDSRSKDAHQSDPEERYNFNERMKLRFGTTEPSSS